ncbi:MAG: NRDE family protein [Leucobacter sp.]|nr:NRDE family protein [Leucobacter sp.]
MCTAVIEVPEDSSASVRLLAVRDEHPARAWDVPGAWWPELPDVVGVRDRVAGGAWLAANKATGTIALLLNRAEPTSVALPQGPNQVASRGMLVLDEVIGRGVGESPRTANFNLVSISGQRASVTSFDGQTIRRIELEPGVHMIAHHDVDDAVRTPRIAMWLPEFRALAGLPERLWRERWVEQLAKSAQLSADDDRAIIRDNRVHGYDTLSLLYCLVESAGNASSASRASSVNDVNDANDTTRGTNSGSSLQIDTAVFARPGHWQTPAFESLRT